MKKYNLYALVAAGLLAGGMSATSASAADLGGNCCADLEERIAELEATTARKGNRKVSLTVSGWVGQQVTFWDDGDESNAYVHDLGTTLGSHVKFTGAAQISPGWSAGYVLQIEAIGSDSLNDGPDQPNGPALYNHLGSDAIEGYGGVQTLQSYWFVKSDQLGKVSVGKQSQASDNAAILVDGSGSLVPANWVAFDTASFFVRWVMVSANNTPAISLTWGGAQSCSGMGGAWGDCNGLTQNVVRYDLPTFGGFSVSASWGDDDMWDVAGRYAGEWAGFKLALAVAYNETSNQNYNNIQTGCGRRRSRYAVLPGGRLPHARSNRPVRFGQLRQLSMTMEQLNFGERRRCETWYGKIGWRSRWSALGHTVFYGEYLNGQDGADGARCGTLQTLEHATHLTEHGS